MECIECYAISSFDCPCFQCPNWFNTFKTFYSTMYVAALKVVVIPKSALASISSKKNASGIRKTLPGQDCKSESMLSRVERSSALLFPYR